MRVIWNCLSAQFAVIKECVTENEHLNRYPDGKAFGCETVRSNSTFTTTYCVCDQDLCNARSLDEQLSQPQPSIPNGHVANIRASTTPIDPLLPPQPQQQRPPPPAAQANRTLLNGNQNQPDPNQVILNPQLLPSARGLPPAGPQQPIVPPQPVDEFSVPADPTSWDPNQSPPSPSLIQEPQSPAEQTPKRPLSSQLPVTSQPSLRSRSGTTPLLLVALNTERVEFITDPVVGTTPKPSNSSRKAPPQSGFQCMVCNEGNLTSNQDCQIQNPLDCRSLFRPGVNLFCFTKAIILPTGKCIHNCFGKTLPKLLHILGQSQIEKRCASEEQLAQELSIPVVQPSCFSGQDAHVRVDYCICGSTKCNQLPIANQANMYPPLTATDRAGTPTANQQHPSGTGSPSQVSRLAIFL